MQVKWNILLPAVQSK